MARPMEVVNVPVARKVAPTPFNRTPVGCPTAVSASPEDVPVAATVKSKSVPLSMNAIVAPTGMFVPVTDMPGTRPAVLRTVMVVLVSVVDPPLRFTVFLMAPNAPSEATETTPPRISMTDAPPPKVFPVFPRTSVPAPSFWSAKPKVGPPLTMPLNLRPGTTLEAVTFTTVNTLEARGSCIVVVPRNSTP